MRCLLLVERLFPFSIMAVMTAKLDMLCNMTYELLSYPAVVGTECKIEFVTEKEGETWRGDFHVL